MLYRKSILAPGTDYLGSGVLGYLSPSGWPSVPISFLGLCSVFLLLDWVKQTPELGGMLVVMDTKTLPKRMGPRLNVKDLTTGFSCIACIVYRVFATRNTGTCPLT